MLDLKNIMKLSICPVALSIAISGITTLATDKVEKEAGTVNKRTEVSSEEARANIEGRYIFYYTYLIYDKKLDKDVAMRQAKIFKKSICSGRSSEYADFYAELIVTRNCSKKVAKSAADVFVKELKLGKKDLYAKYYALLVVDDSLKESDARKQADVFEKEILSGKSNEYADAYASLMISKRPLDERARKYASIYEKEIMSNKSKNYAKFYADLIVYRAKKEKIARMEADIYEANIKNGSTSSYADYYAFVVVEKNADKDEAECQAFLYEKEITGGHSKIYADHYVDLVFCQNKGGDVARKESELYEQSIIEGKTKDYAGYYAFLVAEKGLERGAAMDRACLYERLCKTYSRMEAIYYIDLIYDKKISEPRTKKIMEAYRKEIFSGKSESQARELAEKLYTNDDKLSQKDSNSSTHKRSLKDCNDDECGQTCSKRVKRVTSDEKLKDAKSKKSIDEVSIFKSELRSGRSYDYAKYYTNLIMKEKAEPDLARKQTDIFFDELRKSKNY